MTRRAASGFGWQRKSESGDGSLSLEDGPAAIFTEENERGASINTLGAVIG
jgi:hypothetical protein